MTDETIETSEPAGKLGPADKKPSPVEKAKLESNFLRGTIREELADGNPMFSKPNVQLLKHHGTYQQDDREARTHREGGGKSIKSYMFMVRSRDSRRQADQRPASGRTRSGRRAGQRHACESPAARVCNCTAF